MARGNAARDETRREFEDAEARLLERFGVEAERRWVPAPVVRGRARVLVCGEGPPVVMLNGIGTPASMWAPLMAQLRGFTLYGVDLPGFGLTDATPELARDLRVNAVRFLTEVLDGLGLRRPAFVANSMGSLWAFWLASARPERVSAMLHIGCPALLLGTSAPLPMRLLAVPGIGRVLTQLQPPSAQQVEQMGAMVHEDLAALPELRDLLVATERLPGYEMTFRPVLRALVRLRGARPDVALNAEELARIAPPVQLFWGRDDPFGPVEVGRRAAATLPDAQLHVVSGGHAPWLTQSDHIAPVAEPFLREHAA